MSVQKSVENVDNFLHLDRKIQLCEPFFRLLYCDEEVGKARNTAENVVQIIGKIWKTNDGKWANRFILGGVLHHVIAAAAAEKFFALRMDFC